MVCMPGYARLYRATPVSTSSVSMADLLQRVAEQGDVAAFDMLFQCYAPRVKSYMMRKGADPTTAEELAQEALLTVWRKARLYSGDKGSATTWIFTIARNLRIDRRRREVAWQDLPEARDEEAALVEHRPIADQETGCIRLIASESKARFKGLVARLVQPLTGV